MRWTITPGTLLLLAAAVSAAPLARTAVPQKKEYLSETEATKIRDAGTTGPRIVLYATFAADRIKKLQYEFAHIDPAEIDAKTLHAWLLDGRELALLDAREDGEFGTSHLFWAVPCALSKREIRARALLHAFRRAKDDHQRRDANEARRAMVDIESRIDPVQDRR